MNWLNRPITTSTRACRITAGTSGPPAIRAAAEKLSGAITATPMPSRVKPTTATCQVGEKTITNRDADGDHGAGPEHRHRPNRDQPVAGEPHTRVASR